jgi:hypothetical protein
MHGERKKEGGAFAKPFRAKVNHAAMILHNLLADPEPQASAAAALQVIAPRGNSKVEQVTG